MKHNNFYSKASFILSVFAVSLWFFYAFGNANTSGDKGISISNNAKIIETDTTIEISYGIPDTNRIVIHRQNHTVTLGSSSAAPTEGLLATTLYTTDLATLKQCWVNSSTGVTEDFYVEGDSRMSGYLIGDSAYFRTVKTPTLNNTTGTITTLSGTTANYTRVTAGDSVNAPIIASQEHLMHPKSGIAFNKEDAVMYLKGSKLIFAFRDSGGSYYYYYADLSSGGDINQLTFSLTEP